MVKITGYAKLLGRNITESVIHWFHHQNIKLKQIEEQEVEETNE